MSTSSNRILSIYNSRKNILEILESRGYEVDDYNLFSIIGLNIYIRFSNND